MTAILFACPIDQLHISGFLSRDGDQDIRYIAAKRLQRCSETEFSRVSREFPEHRALIDRVLRRDRVLPASSDQWIPDLCSALDRAAEFWGIE